VLARPLRPPRTGNTHTTPGSQPQRNPSPPSRISRRWPASSSSVLAAARLRALQPDSWPRGEKTRAAARKDPEEQSAQPGGARSHRARFVCPLDTGGPYGCRRANPICALSYSPGASRAPPTSSPLSLSVIACRRRKTAGDVGDSHLPRYPGHEDTPEHRRPGRSAL